MKDAKRVLSIVLVLVMLVLLAPSSFASKVLSEEPAEGNLSIKNLSPGDCVEFGSYPQSEVTDADLIEELNSQQLNWISYRYYSGTGETGSMQEGDYMKYADVTYQGDKYRAVYFTHYRPGATNHSNADSDANYGQKVSGYNTNTVYWFKFEPLQWRILDIESGLMICDKLIDAQPFNNIMYDFSYQRRLHWYIDEEHTLFASVWETSTIRSWLNETFYNVAFDDQEKNHINGMNTLTDGIYTSDDVFLASKDEISLAQEIFPLAALCTDYTFCQGVSRGHINYTSAIYYLRNRAKGYYAGSGHYANVYDVDRGGHFDGGSMLATVSFANYTNGVRPLICYSDLYYNEFGELHKESDVRLEIRDEETQTLIADDENKIDFTYTDKTGTEKETTDDDGLIYINKDEFPISNVTVTLHCSSHVFDGVTMNYEHKNYYYHYDESISLSDDVQLVFYPSVEVLSGSVDADDESIIQPSCIEEGSVQVVCPICEKELTSTLDSKGHLPAAAVMENQIPATCTETGSYESVIYCVSCGVELSRETVELDALGHNDGNNDGKCDHCSTQINNNDGNANQSSGKVCRYCGGTHTGFLGFFIGLIHSILALFGLRKK